MITSPVLFLMFPVKFVKVGLLYSSTAAAKDSHSATELIESLIPSLRSCANTLQLSCKSHHNHAANNTAKDSHLNLGEIWASVLDGNHLPKTQLPNLALECSAVTCMSKCACEHVHTQYCHLHAWLSVHISRQCDGASGAAEAKAVRRH